MAPGKFGLTSGSLSLVNEFANGFGERIGLSPKIVEPANERVLSGRMSEVRARIGLSVVGAGSALNL